MSNVLHTRDANVQVAKASPEKKDEKPKSLEYQRQLLNKRLNGEKTQQYASPTDEIMSPATQKLSAFRNKQLMKKSKPQTLFKTASSKSLETSKIASPFADISPNPSKEGAKE